MTIWAILPAAGIGRRMGSKTPKQYLELNGTAVISLSLQRLLAVSAIKSVVVVLQADDEHWPQLKRTSAGSDGANHLADERIQYAVGGPERYQSVLNGLNLIASEAKPDDWVLVHDAVRPCVRSADIEKLISELRDHPIGGLLGAPVDNTLKKVDNLNRIVTTVSRTNLWSAFTPQMFRYGILTDSIQRVVAMREQVTDEASAIEQLGHTPQMVIGNKDNIKITHEVDLVLASNILKSQAETI